MTKVRTSQELFESQEHLIYETEMLFAVFRQNNFQALEKDLRFALLESFTLHLRNFINFFYPEKEFNTDIYAKDFFVPGEWKSVVPPISPALETARKRANKEVGHLTTERISGVTKKKEWQMGELALEISLLIELFCKRATAKELTLETKERILSALPRQNAYVQPGT
ncbi:MAG: hypothetical protein AAB921_02950 [Patescibacteria group bacterium]